MKKSLFIGLGLIALVTLGVMLLSRPGINTVHKNIVGFPLPDDAKHVEMERPSVFDEWRDDYCIISYNLPAIALPNILSKPPAEGFSSWRPLGEIGVGPHLFTSYEMHHTMISSKTDGRLYYAMLIDLDQNKVYVMSVFN